MGLQSVVSSWQRDEQLACRAPTPSNEPCFLADNAYAPARERAIVRSLDAGARAIDGNGGSDGGLRPVSEKVRQRTAFHVRTSVLCFGEAAALTPHWGWRRSRSTVGATGFEPVTSTV